MSTPDFMAVENAMTTDSNLIDFSSQYLKKDMLSLPDINQGSYTSGVVQFNTSQFASQYINYGQSYFFAPITIQNNNYATATQFTAGTGSAITFKSSAVQIVYNVSVTTTSGANLVSEPISVYINSIRPLINSDLEWSANQNDICFFGVDRNTGASIQYGSISVGYPTNTAYGNTNLNPTLLNRCLMFSTQSSITSTTITYHAFLPLRLIHPLFKMLDFPILNGSFLINLGISGTAGFTNVMPFTVLNSSLAPTTISVGGGSVNGFSSSTCRLYLQAVQLNAKDQEAMQALLDNGHVKRIEYPVTDVFPFVNLITGANGTLSNQVITTNAIRPIRLWVLSVANGAGPSLSSNLFPGGTCNYVKFTNVNLQVNNTNYYANNLLSTFENFEILKDQLPTVIQETVQSGGQIGYNDFNNGSLPYCYDLSRIVQANVNQATSLSFSATCTNAAAADVYFVVERIRTLQITYSKSGMSFLVTEGTTVA